MRSYTLPDGTRVSAGDQFEIGDQRYPGGWLLTALPEEIKEAGITWEDLPDPVAPPPPPPDPVVLAKAALDATDDVALRCFKAGVPYPSDWQTYTSGLRDVVRGKRSDLPARPSYPAGT